MLPPGGWSSQRYRQSQETAGDTGFEPVAFGSGGAASRRLLTVREVAGLLRLSTATVYKLCERGELAHVRVSNAIRIAPASVASFPGKEKLE